MTEAEFLTAILRNSNNRAILARLPSLGLEDAWLVSGALFQTVWNIQTGHDPARGIRDYDLFYFDPDTSYKAEDAAIRHVRAALRDLNITVEIRNQARVHLWYGGKFGAPYPPLMRATDGIDRFLTPCGQVGIHAKNDGFAIYAPSGFGDIAAMIMRPNPVANFQAAPYLDKAARWKMLWPELTVLPAT